MVTVAILQARITSSRLPGKVLAPILGVPMVIRQIERLERAAGIDELVVATSTDASDDPLVEALTARRITVVRGPLDDVLDRFIVAMDAHPSDAVVRLTADCPLASPVVIDRVISAFHDSGADYVSNTMQPSFPDGLDVEVVRAAVLREVAGIATDPPEREHVTLGVYRRHERYDIRNVAGEQDLSGLRWTVDIPEDLVFVTAVYEALYPGNPAFDLPEILELLREHPELSRTTDDSERNAALRGLDTGAMRMDGN